MKQRNMGLLAGLFLGMFVALGLVQPARANHGISCWNRNDAANYAYTGRYEGYNWGGGWWNDNNYDDTPSCPYNGGSGCEGPDCSGFTFKSWAMRDVYGSSGRGYAHWDIGYNIHGPYPASSFRDDCGGACFDVCGGGTASCGSGSYGNTERMDAFASGSHIGMTWNEQSNGYDEIIEALDNAPGTNIWQRNYRVLGEYDGVRRHDWCP
jgi:hypothetical protein